MITSKQSKYLKKLAHHRKPIVTIGNAGLTPAVLAELSSSLEHHELMKIKITAADHSERKTLTSTICDQLKADFVLAVGHIIAIYRPPSEKGKTPRVSFPD